MNAAKSFSVLLQVQSQNDAENIISLFRAARIATRAHRVTSEPDLTEHLADQAWDLIILDGRHPEVSNKFALKAIADSGQSTPAILIADLDDAGATAAYESGIAAAVAKK